MAADQATPEPAGEIQPAAEQNKLATVSADFVRLTKVKRELDDQLKAVKAELDDIEATIIKEMEETGVTKITVDGMTVYIKRELFPKILVETPSGDKDTGRLIETLINAGLDELVRQVVVHQSFAAYIRALPRDPLSDMPMLPPDFEGVVDVSEKFSIQARKA